MTLLSSMVAACSWQTLTPAGEKARVLDANEVVNCLKVGETTASVLPNILFIERNRSYVEDDLAIIARNNAKDLGGDTAVPISKVEDGKQTFAIYRCISY